MKCEACGNSRGAEPTQATILNVDRRVTLCPFCFWTIMRGGSVTLTFEDPPDQAYGNFLLYGPPKTSKTAGAASAPGKILYLNADLPNRIRYAHEKHNQDGRIKWVKLTPGETMSAMIDVARIVQGPAADRPDVVVVDPVGEFHRRLLEDASSRAVSPSLPTYQAVGVHLERFYRMLCEAPVNAVFVAHDHPVKDESDGSVERLPFMGTQNSSPAAKLLGMVDVIGYTGVIETEDGGRRYVSQLVAGKGRQGGDGFDTLLQGEPFRETNLAEWFEEIGLHTTSKAAKPQSKVVELNEKNKTKEAAPA